jgi:hypothetical protein
MAAVRFTIRTAFFLFARVFHRPRFIRRFSASANRSVAIRDHRIILMNETRPPRERPNPPRPQAPPVNSVVAAAVTAHDLDERRKSVLEAEREQTSATRPTRRSGRRRWGL